MVKQLMKAMKLYVIAHVGLAIIYYFLNIFLTINEKAPFEVSKIMLIAFTIVNVVVYVVSNQLNQEKTRSQQMESEYYFYALLIFEAIMAYIAFGLLGK